MVSDTTCLGTRSTVMKRTSSRTRRLEFNIHRLQGCFSPIAEMSPCSRRLKRSDCTLTPAEPSTLTGLSSRPPPTFRAASVPSVSSAFDSESGVWEWVDTSGGRPTGLDRWSPPTPSSRTDPPVARRAASHGDPGCSGGHLRPSKDRRRWGLANDRRVGSRCLEETASRIDRLLAVHREPC